MRYALEPKEINWNEVFEVWVQGDPHAQPRVKFSGGRLSKNKKLIPTRAYTPAGPHQQWEEILKLTLKKIVPKEPLDGPIKVECEFYFKRTKELQREVYPQEPFPHIQKPDRDNAEKKILDVMTKMGVISDDKQVCDGSIKKYYVQKGGEPGVKIRVSQCTDWPYKTLSPKKNKTRKE